MLCFPIITLSGAAKGIHLWFNVVLPSILPCIIISNILVALFGKNLKMPWLYIVFSGLLCGYPLGAKACSDLYGNNPKACRETQFLLALVNCVSPMFLCSFVIIQLLGMRESLPLLAFLYYAPLLLLTICTLYIKRNFLKEPYNNIVLQPQPFIDIVDSAILGGFEIIARLGGYIMLFSILAEFIQHLCPYPFITSVVSGMLEISSGSAYIAAGAKSWFRLPLLLFCLHFGGFSCIAQTSSILSGTFYSIKKYTYHKLIIASVCTAISYLMIYVLSVFQSS